jgi:protein-tyrosine phosphatase
MPLMTKQSFACNVLGIDMSLILQKLNAELIKQADLILVMSQNQQKHIEQTWPFAKGKHFA